jgi:hypothetical protein
MRKRWERWTHRREAAGDREAVLTARAVFWLAGKLSRIKTPQRMYRVVWDDHLATEERPHPFHTVPTKRRWVMCRTSQRALSMAMSLAWDHWNHFALEHDGCPQCHPCPDWRCRGVVCDGREEPVDA